jgi:hypothetical protein
MSNRYTKAVSAIQIYFDVSKECAEFIYHRKRRSSEWVKLNDPSKYLPWSSKLLNHLVRLGRISNIDWSNIKFGHEYEYEAIDDIGSDLHEPTSDLDVPEANDESGWQLVAHASDYSRKILAKIGII